MPAIYGSREEFHARFEAFLKAIGSTITRWQEVEEVHFKLFYGLIGAPKNDEMAAAVYYNIESFEARHRMISNMLTVLLGTAREHKKQRHDWSNNNGGLYKEIKDANENRNKLAHYQMRFDYKDFTNPSGKIEQLPYEARLQPSSYNVRLRLLGRTPDKADHNLSAEIIRGYGKQFYGLVKKINDFHDRLPLPPEANPAREHGLPQHRILEYRRETSRRGRPKPGHP